MFRACLLTSAFLVISIATAAEPEIPAEKRKAVFDAILAAKPKSDVDLAARVKALEKAKINPKLTSNKYPDDPTEPASFPNKLSKDKYGERITKELEDLRAESKRYAENPLAFAPGLKGFDKGEIGTIKNPSVKVAEVIDKNQALLTITSVSPQGANRLNFLLTGIDTSNLADGKAYPLPGVYYVIGNTKVNGATVMQLVPLALTTEERSKLGLPESKSDKK